MRHFKAPKRTIGDLDAKTVARLIASASDLALVLDADGTIKDVSYSGANYEKFGCAEWPGKSWHDIVTLESRPKVDEMLREAKVRGEPQWYQVNHSTEGEQDLPVRYWAQRLSPDGPIIAIGRDMLTASDIQQKLIVAQNQLERDYARLSQAETRYQALFRFSSEALLVIDASHFEIIDANQSALSIFENGTRGLVGRRLGDLLTEESRPDVDAALATARTMPRTDPVDVHLAHKDRTYGLHVGIFRDDRRLYYIARLNDPLATQAPEQERADAQRRSRLIEALPDAFVILDKQRRILSANPAFLALTQLATVDQVKNQPIRRWLGRADVDVDVLFANLGEEGVISRYKMMLRGEFGAVVDIELTGVAALKSDPPCYGLVIRRDVPALTHPTEGEGQFAGGHSVEQLKHLVGRTPLRDLVRQTTDIVERMCIEAALELTGDNRASAAEMLGLSRQSLYLKLRRHQLGGLGEDEVSE